MVHHNGIIMDKRMTKKNKATIMIGAIMVLISLALMFEPYYTWAQDNNHPCRIALDPPGTFIELYNLNPGDSYERSITVNKTGSSSAELFLAWEYLDGLPPLAEPGSLFNQLQMVILADGVEIYRGPMGDLRYDSNNPSRSNTINVTAILGRLIHFGDQMRFDFIITLPGPETGNEFQGSRVNTRLLFFTICANNPPPQPPPPPPPPETDEEVDPEPPGIQFPPWQEPETDETEADFGSILIEPEDPQVSPPLPNTGGTISVLLIIGLLFIILGYRMHTRANDS